MVVNGWFYFCKILSFCLLSQNSDHITHHHEKRVKKARAVKIKKWGQSKKVLLAWLLIAWNWNLHCQEGCKLLGILPRLMISYVRCYSESMNFFIFLFYFFIFFVVQNVVGKIDKEILWIGFRINPTFWFKKITKKVFTIG